MRSLMSARWHQSTEARFLWAGPWS